MTESYHLSIVGEGPAAWLSRLVFGSPSYLPLWSTSPHLAGVVAVSSQAEDGEPDYAEVTVVCTWAQFRSLAAWEEFRKKLFFTVDRAHLFRACPQIDPLDFKK